METVDCNDAEIVLFNSPLYRESFNDGESHLPPLGQGYIVTHLRKHGIKADLVDCVYEQLGVSDIVDFINQGTFANVGFNVFSVNFDLIKEILLSIQRKVNIFIGGKATNSLWKEMLTWKQSNAMTFIIGEGELIFPDLILNRCKAPALFDDGRNRVYLVDKQSFYFPNDLDSIELDRSLFVGREIRNPFGRLEAPIIASRGCIYDCAFCGGAISLNPDITVRYRSPESISNEIQDILTLTPQVTSIRFLDDLFLRDSRSITDACSLFYKFKELHWRCMAHINTFKRCTDLIQDMKASGCDEVFIGIESGSPEMRRKINKVGTIQEIETVIRQLLDTGINVKGYFMCGLPGETEVQLDNTFCLAEKLTSFSKTAPASFRPVVFKFRPYHGTRLYNELFPEVEHLTFRLDANGVGSKHQYSFSAGNFSAVSNNTIDYYISKISNLKSGDRE